MNLPYEPLLEDPDAEHQIRLVFVLHDIAVTCTCQRYRRPIEVRPVFPASEALQVWREYHGLTTVTR